MNYKYNEELYGEKIFEEGLQTNYTKSELTTLVKYLTQVKKKNKKDTETFLYEFCKKYISGFNEVQHFKVIDSALRNGRKKDNLLIKIEHIPIFNIELDYIDKLDIDQEYKKLLLTLLVHKKINFEIMKLHNGSSDTLSAYFGGNKKKYAEVFKSANLEGKYKIDDMIYNLANKKIITSIIHGDIILDFMYEIYKDVVNTEITQVINNKTEQLESKERKTIIYKPNDYEVYENISDFENIGYVFDYYKQLNNVKKCKNFIDCGTFIKANNNRQKYCKECCKEKQLEWQRNSMQKSRTYKM